MKKLWKRGVSALLALALGLGLMTAAGAYDPIDTGAAAALRLHYENGGGGAISDLPLEVYRVAELDGGLTFTAADPFRPAGVFPDGADTLAGWTEETWSAAAATLSAYAQRHREEADWAAGARWSGKTDGNGDLTFTGLPVGLYLVTGSPVTNSAGETYTPTPYLTTLPRWTEAGWQYDAVIDHALKYTRDTPSSDRDTFSVEVRKLWRGDQGVERPGEIQVTLLRNGQKFDSAVLSAENGWHRRWDGLDSQWRNAVWTAVEEPVPEGYTVLLTCEGDAGGVTLTLTNTKPDPEDPPPGPPDEPGGGDNEGGGPGEPSGGENGGGQEPGGPDVPGSGSGTGLPQTGSLWWLAGALTAWGAGLCGAGLLLRRRKAGSREAP